MNPEEIKQARLKLNLTQEEMAHLVGVAFSTWSQWENGHRSPRKIYIEKIQRLIGTE
jgi:putative transcriptional regulator